MTKFPKPLPDKLSSLTNEIVIEGIKLHYVDTKIGRHTLLFLHGNSLSSKIFEFQFSDPALNRHRLIALDLPGHGRSGRPTIPQSIYHLPGYAKIVSQFINQLELDSLIVCGFCLGGHIAIQLLNGPSKTKGLFLAGSTPVHNISDSEQAFAKTEVAQAFFQGELCTSIADKMTNALAAFGNPAVQNAIRCDLLASDPEARTHLAASLAEHGVADEIELLESSNVPVALVHGAEDPITNLAYVQSLNLQNTWRKEVHVIPRTSHLPQIEDSQTLNRLLLDFSQEIFQDTR